MSVFRENWNFRQSEDDYVFADKSFLTFNSKFNSYRDAIEKSLRTETYSNFSDTENQERELKNMLEANNELRLEKDKKTKEYSLQMVQYQTLKNKQQLLTEEIKKTHEAFIVAKKFYKKHLKMYYMIESRSGDNQTVYVQLFTESKKESTNFSLYLQKDKSSGCFKLVSTTPTLNSIEELQRKLQESNDVPGALCSIRQAFKMLNIKKN